MALGARLALEMIGERVVQLGVRWAEWADAMATVGQEAMVATWVELVERLVPSVALLAWVVLVWVVVGGAAALVAEVAMAAWERLVVQEDEEARAVLWWGCSWRSLLRSG